MARRIWIDKRGWTAVDEVDSGSWMDETPLSGLKTLIQSRAADLDWEVVISPEMFVYHHQPAGMEVPPSEDAAPIPGLRAERWHFITEWHEDQTFVVAIPHEFNTALAELIAFRPNRIKILFVPMTGAPGVRLCRFGKALLLDEVVDGMRRWHWIPKSHPVPTGTPTQPPDHFLSAYNQEPWLCYRGDVVNQYEQLTQWNQRLNRALLVLLIPALCIWGVYLWRVGGLQARAADASAYLNDNREEAARIEALQEGGDIAWEELAAIQSFSFRGAPIANGLTQLANQGEPGLRWDKLECRGKDFDLTLIGSGMDEVLNHVDKLRKLDQIESVRFEELKNQSRGRDRVIRVEGRLR